jgi:hypothetical protein
MLYHLSFSTAKAQTGTWKAYMAYHEVQQIQKAGDDLFVLASHELYQYNLNDHSITTYDKINGLSDTNIAFIRWCQQAKRLVAVYSNVNIDLVETNGNVTNISDLYAKAITGDKSVNNIYISGQYAYLSCGFGIVKLDVKRAEISESYMLGFAVTDVTIDGGSIYAKAKNGTVWTASLANNLIDKSYWQQTDHYPSFITDNSDYEKYYETVATLQPGGPKYNYFGHMLFNNNKLFTSSNLISFDIPVCIQVLHDGNWQIYQDEGVTEQTGNYYGNVYCFDIDPTDETHVFAGARNGLYEFRNGKFEHFYNSDNSPIESYNKNDKNYELVTGVKFDNNGNLWLLNSQAPTQSLIKYANGTFTSLPKPELMKLNDGGFTNKSNGNLSKMMIDSEGLLWFTNNHWIHPALYCYNISSDVVKSYENFVNQDGTTINGIGGVSCAVEDLEKNIWIGTNMGPLLLERSQVNSSNPVFTQVKVPRNDGTNYADYLLTNINITAIAIDGGNRKWFGTSNNGVYLISADNMEQIQHFTTDNSYLLSNSIDFITVNNATGEVFFGTGQGLCSYMSDATTSYEEMDKDNVYAYPNPVTKDYTGLITIVGLSYNADVKILAANGALVAEGRSNGGTFTWDCCGRNGKRVASGVYMVATATKDGKKGTVCKIAVVN